MKHKIILLILIVSSTSQIKAQTIDTTFFKNCYHLYLNENFDKARECYLENDTNIYAIYNAAYISDKINDKKSFKKLSKKLISKKMRSPKSFKLYADLNIGDSIVYLKILNKGLKLFENDTVLLSLKANHFMSIKDYKNEIHIVNKILSLKKGKSETLYSARGWAYQMLGENELALNDYNKAIAIDTLYFETYFNIATIYFNQAVDLYDKANIEPDNSKYKALKKNADKELGKAIPYLTQADKIKPNDLTILNALKTIYYRLKLESEYQEINNRINSIK